MSWTLLFQSITAIIAFGIFIDKFHNAGRLDGKLTNWLRDRLVSLFIVLDEMKIRSIAPYILKISIVLLLLAAPLSILIIFIVGRTTILAAYLSGVVIPHDWIILYMIIALFVQLSIIVVLRRIARDGSEISATVGFMLAPVFALAGSAFLSSITEKVQNWGGAVFGLVTQFTFWTSMAPTVILALLFLAALYVKAAFVLTRHVLMVISSGASSPRTNPFVYFSALFAALLLFAKLVPAPWPTSPANGQEELFEAPLPVFSPHSFPEASVPPTPNR